MTEVRQVRLCDADRLARALESAALEEVRALGLPLLRVLRHNLATGVEAGAFTVDGEVAAFFGVSSADELTGLAQVWLMSSPAVRRAPIAFMKECRRWLGRQLARYDAVYDYVDSRYTESLRWLARLGFHNTGTLVMNGVPFYRMLAGRS